MADREASTGSNRFRGDVEGLRAVAVTLVLLYHASLPFVPGGYVGVDVFFVISGFLISTQLVSELHRTGGISLARFYARRAKRLLPAAATVLVTTFLLVRLFVPATRWQTIGGDVLSAAVYVVNWRLAARSVDYLAEGSAQSPVQHFWSLAVEEQYYLLWPLLILLAALVAKAIRKRPTPVLWVGLAVVVIPSFAWSLAETAHSPERAFFETTTRMWELGIGAAVALGAALWARVPTVAATATGWIGLVAIAASGLVFTTKTHWPGYTAAVPTIGTAAVIMAGFATGSAGPAAVLSSPPFRWVGGLSYSLYLWHWPLLAVAEAYRGDLSVLHSVAIVSISFVPAWLTFRFVENPIRYSRAVARSARLALSLGANFTLAGVTAGLALLLLADATGSAAGSFPRSAALGAAVLRDDARNDPAGAPVDVVGWMTPQPSQATKDVPVEYAHGCQQAFANADVKVCQAGDTHGQVTIAVVGDSKATQWLPALRLIAAQNSWRLTTYLKSSCAFTLAPTPLDGELYDSCLSWATAVRNRLIAEPPDYVLTTHGQSQAFDEDGALSKDAMIVGLRTLWGDLTSAGSKVVVIADNPSPGMTVYECVQRNLARLSACTFDRGRYDTSFAPVQHRAAADQDGVEIVDLFDAICPTERCAPVIGNVLIYRQGSHLTRTYVETLTPRLATALSAVGLQARYQAGG